MVRVRLGFDYDMNICMNRKDYLPHLIKIGIASRLYSFKSVKIYTQPLRQMTHCAKSRKSFPNQQPRPTPSQDAKSQSISPYWHVSSIFPITPISVPFSNAAATRSLSASCLLTSSAVVCVPSLIRTSVRKRGGRDCSRRTRTPSPITVAKLQCVIVGVMRTVTVRRGEEGLSGREGAMWMSGRETTARAPREMGCSGSVIVDIRSRSLQRRLASFPLIRRDARERHATNHILPVHRWVPRAHCHHLRKCQNRREIPRRDQPAAL